MGTADGRLKLSSYNWLIEFEDAIVAFNGLTCAIARVSVEHILEVKELFSRNTSDLIHLDSISSELQGPLVECGFLIPVDFDELDYLHVVNQAMRFSPHLRSVTAVITTSCNFACSYCYQGQPVSRGEGCMSEEVIDGIAKKAGESLSQDFTLCLYGGEPLLYPECCISLCRNVRTARSSRTGKLGISIITNGFFLSGELAKQLADVGVETAQVTLDGSQSTHDARRPLKGGSATYERILDNVLQASAVIDIALRVNVEEGIDPHLAELRDRLAGNPRIAVYSAATRYDHCGQPERSIRNLEYIDRLADGLEAKRLGTLEVKFVGCAAVSLGSMVVMPDGSLIRCWSEIGAASLPSDASSILSIGRTPLRAIYKWMSWDPFASTMKCYQCKMLPNCGGGCPADYFRDGEPRCLVTEEVFHKRIIDNYIRDRERGGQDKGKRS